MRRYTLLEKSEILKEIESIGNVALVCRKRGISYNTVQTWIRKGITSKGNNLKENLRSLKKRNVGLEVQNKILKELLKKTHQVF